MRVDLDRLYDETVTIVNRLDAKDCPLKQDTYFSTVLHRCMWTQRHSRTVADDGTVTIGITHVVQIPESDRFMPYREWKDAEKFPEDDPFFSGGNAAPFTARLGDYVFKGEVEVPADAMGLKKLASTMEPDVFQVQAFRDLTHGDGMDHGTDGIMRFAECYYIEG